MVLTPCRRCTKANWLTIYKSQCFMGRSSIVEILLIGDSIIKHLTRYKGTQHDLTPKIYALHKITIALKFMSYINRKLRPSF